MKARLPKGYSNSGANTNIQQLAPQAQKMQEEMDEASKQLDEKDYSATAGGGAVTATVKGSLEVTSLEISKDVVDPEDIEGLQDLIIAAANQALEQIDKTNQERIGAITGGMKMPF